VRVMYDITPMRTKFVKSRAMFLDAREISQGGSIWIPLLRLSLRWLRNVDYDDKAKPY